MSLRPSAQGCADAQAAQAAEELRSSDADLLTCWQGRAPEA